jgi:indole-3-glycerol phosphate synthase
MSIYLEELPASVLKDIVGRAQLEMAAARERQPLSELQRAARDAEPTRGFHDALVKAGFSMIAEVKRRSPSGGEMRHQDYLTAGRLYDESPAVSAISVLTNESDFGMKIGALSEVRRITRKPLLRKDFIFDEYQIYQARVYGADAILLMANLLTREGMHGLSRLAFDLGMDVLFEAHDPEEVRKFPADARLCGINSRKFVTGAFAARSSGGESSGGASKSDFSTNARQFELIECLPAKCVKVAESGLAPEGVAQVRRLGFDSILVGATLLMAPQGVAATLRSFEDAIARSPSASGSFQPVSARG